MLHLRRQLGDGMAAGVGVNPVEGVFLCTFGGSWMVEQRSEWGQNRSRVHSCAPSGWIAVAGLGAWGANRGRGCIPVRLRWRLDSAGWLGVLIAVEGAFPCAFGGGWVAVQAGCVVQLLLRVHNVVPSTAVG